MKKDDRRLRIGLLGCGPIAQAAHLDALRKARNAELYALCDVARGLTDRLAAACQPDEVYNDFAEMLADRRVEAVAIAVADPFHVPMCRQALEAGKPVLVEEPLGAKKGVGSNCCNRLRGRPRGRSVQSRPHRLAIRVTRGSEPRAVRTLQKGGRTMKADRGLSA
jgi:hypothetical protein